MAELTKEWYVVNTYAGHETRVKENLERRAETMGIQENLYRILVAEEEEITFKKWKTSQKNEKLVSRVFVCRNDNDR